MLTLALPMMCHAQSVTFATEFPRADGTWRPISFDGDRVGSAVSGRLAVDGQEVDVIAGLAKEGVSGRFEVGGKEIGRFTAKVVGEELRGSHELSGQVGGWSIPLREIPKVARDVLKTGVTD